MSEHSTVFQSRWLHYGQWLLIPLLVFMAAELGARQLAGLRTRRSYPELLAAPPTVQLDAVFVGSSRVAAAVASDAFDAQMADVRGAPFHSLNQGQGHTNLHQHVLGLRQLFAQHPERFAGCTLFLEAPGGLVGPVGWQGQWFNAARPELLVELLQAGDLPAFLASEGALEPRLEILAIWALSASRLAVWRRGLREAFVRRVGSLAERTGAQLGLLESHADSSDLSSGGGIRTDAAGIALARKLAEESAARAGAPQPGAYPDSVLQSLWELARENGGELVLFRMPVSSLFDVDPDPELSKRFEEWRQQHAVQLLEPEFSSDDGDFPDLWHLARSRSSVFSRALARAWAD